MFNMARFNLCSYIEAKQIEYLKAIDLQDRLIAERNN